MTAGELAEHLRGLEPASVRSSRSRRYRGGGMAVRLEELAPEDRARVRALYDRVRGVYRRWLESRHDPDWKGIWARLQPLAAEERVERIATLGAATATRVDEEGGKAAAALHDIRGGALTAASAQVAMAPRRPGPDDLLSLVFLCRDHAKIMRNAVADLDPEARAADEAERAHEMRDIVEQWDGATHRVGAAAARVEVHGGYAGGISSCCLEVSAVDRVLYNLVNNAVRHAEDGTVALAALPHPETSVRIGVANRVSPDQERWVDRAGEEPAGLFRPGRSRNGEGLGLANCASFVSRAYGIGVRDESVSARLVGARVVDRHFLAWFHWPRLEPGDAGDGPAA